MSGIWLVSYVGLWLIVILLLLAVGVLARQVGLLYVRIGPTGARTMPSGPQLGDRVPRREYRDLVGHTQAIGGAADQPTLLVFVSPTCSACDTVASALSGIARSERDVAVVAISIVGDEVTNRSAAKRWWGEQIPLILAPQAMVDFQIHTFPSAIVLDASGVVRGKGVVNQVEHLHSLLNALETEYATVDQFIEARRPGSSIRVAPGEQGN